MAIICPVNTLPKHIDSGPWMLDPEITYLNHGSFGARTASVFEAQQRHKLEFEASPVDYLDRKRHLFIDARQTVAGFVGCDCEGFGFVENATTGVGSVIRSIEFDQGDEILTTNHVYNGVRQLLSYHARRNNLLYSEVSIPLPIVKSSEIVSRITSACTSSTKVLVVDHVASSSSIVFPIAEIVQICKEKDILVLVDGAHAPGMLTLNVNKVGADWYVGNLHKWVCAPLGAAFVWTSQQHRSTTHPMTVSHWLDQGYTSEFDWQGTRDVSAWITAADAIRYGESIGWDRIRTHNHQLVTWMHESLIHEWGVEPLAPLDGSMFGSMATVLLQNSGPQTADDCLLLRDQLYSKYRIEVPIIEFQGRGALRLSAHLYSKTEDIDLLKTAMRALCP